KKNGGSLAEFYDSGSDYTLRATPPGRFGPALRTRYGPGSDSVSPTRHDRLDACLVHVFIFKRHHPSNSINNGAGRFARYPFRCDEHPGRNDFGPTTGGHMMKTDAHQKVNAGHLKRNAYLYVRQSTIRQVLENTESTKRQYALQQRAIVLGWPVEQIVVIDSDLGQSGASATDREGFQKLVADVGMGKAGIVLGLEVSRLARN